jgi:hypothetical protein
MWWNFVARTPDEIRAARDDWEAHRRFGDVTAHNGPRLSAPSCCGWPGRIRQLIRRATSSAPSADEGARLADDVVGDPHVAAIREVHEPVRHTRRTLRRPTKSTACCTGTDLSSSGE